MLTMFFILFNHIVNVDDILRIFYHVRTMIVVGVELVRGFLVWSNLNTHAALAACISRCSKCASLSHQMATLGPGRTVAALPCVVPTSLPGLGVLLVVVLLLVRIYYGKQGILQLITIARTLRNKCADKCGQKCELQTTCATNALGRNQNYGKNNNCGTNAEHLRIAKRMRTNCGKHAGTLQNKCGKHK
jgi:hypothetical protein